MEFPRLVYKSASVHKSVENSEEYSAALYEGWFDSVTDAMNPKAASVGRGAASKLRAESEAKPAKEPWA